MGTAAAGILLIMLGGASALGAGGDARLASKIGALTVIGGCVLALVAAASVLWSGTPSSVYLPWALPGAALALELDVLSAYFMVPAAIVAGVCALYGLEYLRGDREALLPGASWFFYGLLVGGMLIVLTARNALLFLIGWELMSLAPFFLMSKEYRKAEVSYASLVYLIATHLGAACLIVCFILLAGGSGDLDFATFAALSPDSFRGIAVFLLGFLGFGAKAGLVPFHVWLPEAHPAAPSHVSALMSGVMIKMGVYGLFRLFTFFDLTAVPLWWAVLLLLLGAASGVLGVLYALSQHDLKRLLAYSSVENVGIIALGLGLGLAGLHYHLPVLVVCGFAGALLHTLNHACFKPLLFLGAGVVLHATGTRRMDRLGGLLRAMPRTGVCMLIGSAAAAALPPLNGFAGEFVLYLGSFAAFKGAPRSAVAFPMAAVAMLALIGGLAAVCFVKAFGVVFLGEPRAEREGHRGDPGSGMRAAVTVLAAGCVALGLLAPWVLDLAAKPLRALLGVGLDAAVLADLRASLMAVSGAGVVVIVLAAAIYALGRKLLRGRPVAAGVTWDCGYAAPTARMQYTASSFTAPVTQFFAPVLRPRSGRRLVAGYFPQTASLHSEVTDVSHSRFWLPLFRRIARTCQRLRWLQPARVQLFAVYIVAVLTLLLGWFLLTQGGRP